jgi:hypothetical protein
MGCLIGGGGLAHVNVVIVHFFVFKNLPTSTRRFSPHALSNPRPKLIPFL